MSEDAYLTQQLMENDGETCPQCGGEDSDDCDLCLGRGTVSRSEFENWHKERKDYTDE